MKRLCLLLALLMVALVVGVGCESSHDRYRQMTWRRDLDADWLGIQDDFDTTVLLAERPTHLSEWYHK